jgi:hypothetical protein
MIMVTSYKTNVYFTDKDGHGIYLTLVSDKPIRMNTTENGATCMEMNGKIEGKLILNYLMLLLMFLF